MKKHLKLALIVALSAVLLLAGGTAVWAWGPGGGRGWPGGSNGLEAIAQALGMTADELSAKLQAGEKLADLAEAAGVDLQTLKNAADAARQAAVREAIEQAVKDGKLTREQADWMLQGLEQGYGPGGFGRRGFMFPFFGGRGLGFGPDRANGLDAAAKALGMTTEQLELQLWGGRTLAELAEKAGVDLQDVRNAVEAARQEAMRQAIEQAVENGRLTREQADWMLQGIEQGYVPGGRGIPGGCGGFRGPGRGGGWGSFPAPAPSGASGAGFRAPRMSLGSTGAA
ncbi:MAG: hypothetical protein H5T69_12600 [Chloroflexi bacterium]|nr:hypothetical protein [Chloroflexota bacterium]